jgi:hypothetical protein
VMEVTGKSQLIASSQISVLSKIEVGRLTELASKKKVAAQMEAESKARAAAACRQREKERENRKVAGALERQQAKTLDDAKLAQRRAVPPPAAVVPTTHEIDFDELASSVCVPTDDPIVLERLSTALQQRRERRALHLQLDAAAKEAAAQLKEKRLAGIEEIRIAKEARRTAAGGAVSKKTAAVAVTKAATRASDRVSSALISVVFPMDPEEIAKKAARDHEERMKNEQMNAKRCEMEEAAGAERARKLLEKQLLKKARRAARGPKQPPDPATPAEEMPDEPVVRREVKMQIVTPLAVCATELGLPDTPPKAQGKRLQAETALAAVARTLDEQHMDAVVSARAAKCAFDGALLAVAAI